MRVDLESCSWEQTEVSNWCPFPFPSLSLLGIMRAFIWMITILLHLLQSLEYPVWLWGDWPGQLFFWILLSADTARAETWLMWTGWQSDGTRGGTWLLYWKKYYQTTIMVGLLQDRFGENCRRLAHGSMHGTAVPDLWPTVCVCVQQNLEKECITQQEI